MKIYYYDIEALDMMFCNLHGCDSCHGTDHSGEPNGYGCDPREEWVEKQLKSGDFEECGVDGFDSLFVKLSDYEDLFEEMKKVAKVKEVYQQLTDVQKNSLDERFRMALAAINDVNRISNKAIEDAPKI